MQSIRKKIHALTDKRKLKKEAQSSPDSLQPSPKSKDNQTDSSAQITDRIKVTAPNNQAQAPGATVPSPTTTQVDSRAQIEEHNNVSTLNIVSGLVPTHIPEPVVAANVEELTPTPPSSPSVDFNFNQHNLELAQAELKTASESFDANFHKYLAKNTGIVTFDVEINTALHASHSENDIQQSANQFRQQLNKVIHVRSQNAELASHKWYNKVGSFVLSLYPAVRMTLGVTSEIAGVAAQYVSSFADRVERWVFALAGWRQWSGFDISGELLPNF